MPTTPALLPRLRRLAAHPAAQGWLGLLAFAESIVFPLPTDLLLVPMALAQPAYALRFALIATLGSVLGGLAGYAAGLWLMESFGQPLIAFYHMETHFATFSSQYQSYGGWAVLLAAFTPIPYKLAALASGALELPVLIFLLASLAGRALRFFALAYLCQLVGSRLEIWLLWLESGWMRVAILLTLLASIALLWWIW